MRLPQNRGSVSVSTDSAGVTIAAAPLPAQVPLLPPVAWAALALLLLGAVVRPRS